MKRLLPVVISILGLVSPHVAHAGGRQRPEQILDQWQEWVRQADKAIEDRRYPEAEALSQRLLDGFAERLAGGPEAGKFYASALVRRALARIGQEQLDAAAWDWEVARSLMPSLPECPFCPEPSAEPEEIYLLETPGLVEPKVLARISPRYTEAARSTRMHGTVVLTFVLDAEGRLRHPRLTQSVDPGLDFAALESFRSWRFQPAEVAGRPVSMHYETTIQFKITEPFRVSPGMVSPANQFPKPPLVPPLVAPPGP